VQDSRIDALRIFQAGVRAADPEAAVTAALGQVSRPALIVAVGKAARLMAQAALGRFSGVPTVVVTNYENDGALEGATVFASGHPVPDAAGARAAQAVIAALHAAKGPVLALISGGGSALLPAPAPGLTLEDKADVNRLLLGAGLDIRAMNLVRQQLSDLKGGGFLRHAAPHPVTALILSDVIGDDLSAIASGPTVGPIGTPSDAIAMLQQAGLWERLPAAVVRHLQAAQPPAELPEATNILIGSNTHSVEAMRVAAGTGRVIPTPVEGDVADAARFICDNCGPGITLWGGETTVVLKGKGRGGRNQELALRIALEAEKRGWTDWTCLQGGSDGRDGPTDAAGGIVDGNTLFRIKVLGGDIDALLEQNDSYAALEMAGDLLITGATGTNVADLGVMIRKGGS
jgi:hydroxypyruvate reductase